MGADRISDAIAAFSKERIREWWALEKEKSARFLRNMRAFEAERAEMRERG